VDQFSVEGNGIGVNLLQVHFISISLLFSSLPLLTILPPHNSPFPHPLSPPPSHHSPHSPFPLPFLTISLPLPLVNKKNISNLIKYFKVKSKN